jgi:hypothetical protein
MAITRTLLQLRGDIRKAADIEGTSYTERHPDSDVTDYANRGVAAFYRVLKRNIPDQRFLTSSTKTTTAGTSLYALSGFTSTAAALQHLISVELDASGVKRWLEPYEMNEHAELSDTNVSTSGVPQFYRLRAGSIDILPAPDSSSYTLTIWYVPHQTELTGDANTVDVLNRLDEYVIAWGARIVATKDKQWDLYDRMTAQIGELEREVETFSRSLDLNSPSRMIDTVRSDRYGRSRRWR